MVTYNRHSYEQQGQATTSYLPVSANQNYNSNNYQHKSPYNNNKTNSYNGNNTSPNNRQSYSTLYQNKTTTPHRPFGNSATPQRVTVNVTYNNNHTRTPTSQRTNNNNSNNKSNGFTSSSQQQRKHNSLGFIRSQPPSYRPSNNHTTTNNNNHINNNNQSQATTTTSELPSDIHKLFDTENDIIPKQIKFVHAIKPEASKLHNPDLPPPINVQYNNNNNVTTNNNKIQSTGLTHNNNNTSSSLVVDENAFIEPSRYLYDSNKLLPYLQWSKPQPIGVGLNNLGNTCFFNALIQCLAYLPPLMYYVRTNEHIQSCRLRQTNQLCFFCKLCALLIDIHSSHHSISPTDLARNIRLLNKRFQIGRQEDSHELLRYLLDKLEYSELYKYNNTITDNQIKQTTIVSALFGGYYRSQVKCLHCNYDSNIYEQFLDLSLEIYKVQSIRDALSHYTLSEKLDDKNLYRCKRCTPKLVPAKKQITIYKPPYILSIQLKRFSYTGQKINNYIKYDTLLDLAPYMSKEYSHNQHNSDNKQILYKLYGVLVHSGYSIHSGHYYSYVYNSNNYWYEINDSHVSQVSENKVINQNAYMLFYVRCMKHNNNGKTNTPNKQNVTDNTLTNGIHIHDNGVLSSHGNKHNNSNVMMNDTTHDSSNKPATPKLNNIIDNNNNTQQQNSNNNDNKNVSLIHNVQVKRKLPISNNTTTDISTATTATATATTTTATIDNTMQQVNDKLQSQSQLQTTDKSTNQSDMNDQVAKLSDKKVTDTDMNGISSYESFNSNSNEEHNQSILQSQNIQQQQQINAIVHNNINDLQQNTNTQQHNSTKKRRLSIEIDDDNNNSNNDSISTATDTINNSNNTDYNIRTNSNNTKLNNNNTEFISPTAAVQSSDTTIIERSYSSHIISPKLIISPSSQIKASFMLKARNKINTLNRSVSAVLVRVKRKKQSKHIDDNSSNSSSNTDTDSDKLFSNKRGKHNNNNNQRTQSAVILPTISKQHQQQSNVMKHNDNNNGSNNSIHVAPLVSYKTSSSSSDSDSDIDNNNNNNTQQSNNNDNKVQSYRGRIHEQFGLTPKRDNIFRDTTKSTNDNNVTRSDINTQSRSQSQSVLFYPRASNSQYGVRVDTWSNDNDTDNTDKQQQTIIDNQLHKTQKTILNKKRDYYDTAYDTGRTKKIKSKNDNQKIKNVKTLFDRHSNNVTMQA